MEEISLANLDTNKREAIAQEFDIDLIEDSCFTRSLFHLGFCFEVHLAVKCGHFFYLEFAETGSVKDFGILPMEDKGTCRLRLCSLPGEPENGLDQLLQRSPPEFSSCNTKASERDQDNGIDWSYGLEE
ncbi:putative ataxin-7-like protein 3B [Carlito syrichta]|uniref:Ataxin-7-like protein 3B n=1 Tax=Carlito syrichta TaxID=1868482 RepID=A0A1U7TIC8_CARSF|nr:putative ataxin-7-like protein 3B [Carlito syrichta]